MDWKERANATEERLRLLFTRGCAGDGAAYRQFLQELGGHLRAFLRRRLAQLPDDVEDLVQESLMAIHLQRHTYRPGQPLTAWVHAIARYKMIDLLRQRGRTSGLHDPLDEELEVFATCDTDASDARRDLATVLATLTERQRRVVLMMKVEGASVAETARATGMSESAVKTGLHRSLKALAARFRGGT